MLRVAVQISKPTHRPLEVWTSALTIRRLSQPLRINLSRFGPFRNTNSSIRLWDTTAGFDVPSFHPRTRLWQPFRMIKQIVFLIWEVEKKSMRFKNPRDLLLIWISIQVETWLGWQHLTGRSRSTMYECKGFNNFTVLTKAQFHRYVGIQLILISKTNQSTYITNFFSGVFPSKWKLFAFWITRWNY